MPTIKKRFQWDQKQHCGFLLYISNQIQKVDVPYKSICTRGAPSLTIVLQLLWLVVIIPHYWWLILMHSHMVKIGVPLKSCSSKSSYFGRLWAVDLPWKTKIAAGDARSIQETLQETKLLWVLYNLSVMQILWLIYNSCRFQRECHPSMPVGAMVPFSSTNHGRSGLSFRGHCCYCWHWSLISFFIVIILHCFYHSQCRNIGHSHWSVLCRPCFCCSQVPASLWRRARTRRHAIATSH